MTNIDIIELLDTVLSASQVDPASMQVFDAIALSARLDTQVRTLAEYIVNSQQMSLQIDTSAAAGTYTTTKIINNKEFCTIAVNVAGPGTTVTITFTDRSVWQARAFKVVDNRHYSYICTVTDKTITINNAASDTPITLQFM